MTSSSPSPAGDSDLHGCAIRQWERAGVRARPTLYFIASILLLIAAHVESAPLLLAENNTAKTTITLHPTASKDLKEVASDLAHHLHQITGATFQITTTQTPSDQAILLGTIAHYPDRALTSALEVRNKHDGKEAFAIRTDPTRLRLIGATDKGASHAAYRFLESIGCRWLFPNETWHVMPKAPRLQVELNETDRPAILARRIWYGWGNFSDAANPGKPQRDYQLWARRNRMASSFEVSAGHAWENLIHSNKKLFEEHPEYRALVKGKRQGLQLCVSNPAVKQLAVDHTLAHFKRHPDADMASMEASDGGDHCECGDCKKLGTISNQVFGLANHVAKAIQQHYPGKMVGVLAYNQHSEPPDFDLEPNVYVQLTAGFTTGRYTYDQLLDLWPKRSRNLGFYDYFSVWAWDRDLLPGGRGANTHYITDQIRKYHQRGATSIDAESGNNWGPHGRGYVLANRLMWNPGADPQVILNDFHDKAFGPAAEAVRRYYDRLDPGRLRLPDSTARVSESIFSKHLLALAVRDLNQATELASDHPEILARLDHLKQYLRYNHLTWLRDREPNPEKKKQLTLEIIRHAYRTRYTYMTHWTAVRNSETPELAKKYKEPTWNALGKPEPNQKHPWQDDSPVTKEETARWFEEALAYFQPQPVEEKSFYTDLAPVRFDQAKPADTNHHYQNPARYALHIEKDKPATINVTAGTIAWYRDRAPATWTLIDSNDKEIANGSLALDGEPHPITLNVPQTGTYTFICKENGAGWRIHITHTTPAALLLDPHTPLMHAGHMPRAHFFVPKNTKTLHYFWSGGPHKLHTPDGQLHSQITTTKEFVSVPVPQGADGQPWSLTELAPGHLYFFNAPNTLSANPQTMLLPTDVRD